jgi:hypothetical protein
MTKKLRGGDPAPNVTVLDSAGQPYELRLLWQNGPVLLTFLRHFG